MFLLKYIQFQYVFFLCNSKVRVLLFFKSLSPRVASVSESMSESESVQPRPAHTTMAQQIGSTNTTNTRRQQERHQWITPTSAQTSYTPIHAHPVQVIDSQCSSTANRPISCGPTTSPGPCCASYNSGYASANQKLQKVDYIFQKKTQTMFHQAWKGTLKRSEVTIQKQMMN